MNRKSQRRQDDGGIKETESELVGNVSPGRLDEEFRLYALVGEEAKLVRDNDKARRR